MNTTEALDERYAMFRRVLGLRQGMEYGVRMQYGAAVSVCATANTTTENLHAAYAGLCAIYGFEPKPDECGLSFVNLDRGD